MKFGFLAHPTSRRGQAYVRAIDLMNKLIDEGEHGYRRETWQRSDQIPFFEAGVVRSLTGAECGGLLYEFPLTAQEILKGVVAAQAAVVRAVNTLEAAGADLVGLGGATSIVGGRGVVTQSEVSVPVTSGNSLTTFAAHAELKHVMDVLGVAPGQARVAVLGYPGSIALAIARMLIADGVAVDLVHSGRSSEAILKRHLGDSWTGAELFSSVEPCYERDRLFVTATSSGDVIDEERLAPGSVVVDVALPRDVIRARRPREDVLTIDGGFVSADPGVMLGATLGGMTVSRHINGCLAETVILGLEGLVESYSIGRELPLDKVRRIGEIAAKHGFVPLPMSSWEEQIGDSDIERLGRWWEAAARPKTAAADISAGMALERWKRFSDRLLVNHMRFNYIDVVLEHGRGCVVSSAEADYLDMDAGHGTAILGHDDPGVREAVLAHLNDSPVTAATLCLSIPRRAGVLCERISGLFPVPGRVVTLTTSGEEAVQCALRTAMAATGRPGLLRVDPFAPAPGVQVRVSTGMAVLPGSVPANLAMVEAALDESVGALFLEPFVNELAPDGRAAAAQLYQSIAQLCRSRGTVLVVDERLTAMRTAAVFAFPDLGLDPDIVLLGESLGAAAVPLGATCVRPELWELASQHFPGSPVAISPLGGNDLGAVAGLATLDRVEDPAFWEGVRASGLELREGLTGVVERYAFATKAYGAGLLWHLRCAAPMDEALEGLRDDITARSPGALRTMIRELPVDVRQTGTVWSALFADALEQFLFDRINTKLAQDHHILLDRTRRASRTLLMAPPLTISTAQVQRFARALDAVFDDLSTFDIGAR